MKAHVLPFFGQRLAAEITVDDCREYRAHRRKLGIPAQARPQGHHH